MLEIYRLYQELCERAGVVDFAELLLRVLELIRDDDEIRGHYQRVFSTFWWMSSRTPMRSSMPGCDSWAGAETPVFVVGDDDQSIYGWRGARIENIHHFEQDFASTRVIRLEQNYRSTGTILKAANALIENNSSRLGKELWTQSEDGEPIMFYSAYNEKDEARFVIDRIESWVSQGRSRKEIAVLYRSNAQSRQFEETLVTRGVPYRVYGGLRFFERAEIKDTLAYLRMISTQLRITPLSVQSTIPHAASGKRRLMKSAVMRVHNRLRSGTRVWICLNRNI